MTTPTDEQQRIEDNIAVIRNYLEIRFPSCDIDPTSDLPGGYRFKATDLKRGKQYKLWVARPRLSDKRYSPLKTQNALYNEDIAWKMIQEGEDGFFWHPDNLEPHTGP